jgi:hypothetical protein
MLHFIALLCRLSVCVFRRSVLVAGLGFCMVYSVAADDIAVSEQSFDCILGWPQIRNTRIKHSDPEKLKEAMRIFRDSIPERSIPLARSCSLFLLKQW